MCVAIKEQSSRITISEVKKDKGGYKKRSEWSFEELKEIQGAGDDEIAFIFGDKVYKYQSATIFERDSFTQEMFKIGYEV